MADSKFYFYEFYDNILVLRKGYKDMQVQGINNYQSNTTFGNKGTYLNKAKLALMKENKDYFLSLHNEAKARLHYSRYEKNQNQLLEQMDNPLENPIRSVRLLANTIKERVLSSHFYTKAHKKCNLRFAAPDKPNSERHYQIKTEYLAD